MKTETLIRLLAADNTQPVTPIGRSLAAAFTMGGSVSVLLFVLTMHPRADITAALYTPRFVSKLLICLSLAGAAAILLIRAARPLPSRRLSIIAIPLLLLIVAIVIELSVMPASTWLPRLIGRNARHCLSLIPLLSLAPAASVLIALTRGAPLRPALAGAAAGLVAGGFGAVLYGLTCPDDSPLFVGTWYTLAIGAVATASAWVGNRLLRW